MDDLIRRQDAIRAVTTRDGCGRCEKAIKSIPSAQKKGHWTRAEADKAYFTCSYCKENNIKGRKAYLPSYASTLKFCPNCGADMRGDGDG